MLRKIPRRANNPFFKCPSVGNSSTNSLVFLVKISGSFHFWGSLPWMKRVRMTSVFSEIPVIKRNCPTLGLERCLLPKGSGRCQTAAP